MIEQHVPMVGIDYRRQNEKLSLTEEVEVIRRSRIQASLASDDDRRKASEFLRSGFGRGPVAPPYQPAIIAPTWDEVPW